MVWGPTTGLNQGAFAALLKLAPTAMAKLAAQNKLPSAFLPGFTSTFPGLAAKATSATQAYSNAVYNQATKKWNAKQAAKVAEMKKNIQATTKHRIGGQTVTTPVLSWDSWDDYLTSTGLGKKFGTADYNRIYRKASSETTPYREVISDLMETADSPQEVINYINNLKKTTGAQYASIGDYLTSAAQVSGNSWANTNKASLAMNLANAAESQSAYDSALASYNTSAKQVSSLKSKLNSLSKQLKKYDSGSSSYRNTYNKAAQVRNQLATAANAAAKAKATLATL